MFPTRRLPLIVIPALVVVLIAVGFAAWSGLGQGRADPGVRVVDGTAPGGGSPVERTFSSAQDAVAFASSRAGFTVGGPSNLPSGYALVEVDIPPKPPSSAPGAPLRATLKLRKGDTGFQILLVNQPFTFDGDDTSHLIASLSAGARVFKVVGDVTTDYTLLTASRGAVITARNPSPLADDEAVRILSSLPQN